MSVVVDNRLPPIVHRLLIDETFLSPKQEYLYRYGYLERPSRSERLSRLMSVEDLTNAIKTLQRIRGLQETGKLDDPETVQLVDESRCGVPDFGPGDLARRKRRYKLQGTSWPNKVNFSSSAHNSTAELRVYVVLS